MDGFYLTPLPHGFEVRMKASLALVDTAVEEARTLCMKKGIENSLFATLITIREGLTNAVRHGSILDKTAWIRFSFCVENQVIQMEFEDQGPGFDWKKALETTAAPESESGRGLQIIRLYSHSMAYSKNGRLLHVTICPSNAFPSD